MEENRNMNNSFENEVVETTQQPKQEEIKMGQALKQAYNDALDEDPFAPKKSKIGRLIYFLSTFVILAVFCYGGYVLVTKYIVNREPSDEEIVHFAMTVANDDIPAQLSIYDDELKWRVSFQSNKAETKFTTERKVDTERYDDMTDETWAPGTYHEYEVTIPCSVTSTDGSFSDTGSAIINVSMSRNNSYGYLEDMNFSEEFDQQLMNLLEEGLYEDDDDLSSYEESSDTSAPENTNHILYYLSNDDLLTKAKTSFEETYYNEGGAGVLQFPNYENDKCIYLGTNLDEVRDEITAAELNYCTASEHGYYFLEFEVRSDEYPNEPKGVVMTIGICEKYSHIVDMVTYDLTSDEDQKTYQNLADSFYSVYKEYDDVRLEWVSGY